MISDNDLLRAVAGGDESALAACYDRYRLILFGLTVRILHNRADAEDVLQEVFLQVWRRARDFDETRGRAFTWLVTIARSRALDRLRSVGSRTRLAEEASRIVREDFGDAAADAAESETGAIVRNALAELPEDQKRALFLAYFEGFTQTEIAAHLGAPLGTVKTRTRSGMIRLRKLLGQSRHPIQFEAADVRLSPGAMCFHRSRPDEAPTLDECVLGDMPSGGEGEIDLLKSPAGYLLANPSRKINDESINPKPLPRS